MNEEEFETVQLMAKHGGSFVQSLAVCFQHADPRNFKILKNAFQEYWKHYNEMYKKGL